MVLILIKHPQYNVSVSYEILKKLVLTGPSVPQSVLEIYNWLQTKQYEETQEVILGWNLAEKIYLRSVRIYGIFISPV